MADQERWAELFSDTPEEEKMVQRVPDKPKSSYDQETEARWSGMFNDENVPQKGEVATVEETVRRAPTPEDFEDGRGFAESIGRFAAITGRGVVEGLAETLEAGPKLVAGAVDEVLAKVGVSEGYPIQEFVDKVIRFDESVESFIPEIEPETPVEFGGRAFGRGAGSAGLITGGTIQRGRQALVGPEGATAGQVARLRPGEALTTPGAALTPQVVQTRQLSTGEQVLGERVLERRISAQIAADPRRAITGEAAITTAGAVGAGTGAALAPTEQERESYASFGEVAGIITGGFSPLAVVTIKNAASKGPSGMAIRWVGKKVRPGVDIAKAIFDRKTFKELTLSEKFNPRNWRLFIDDAAIQRFGRNDVLEHIDRMVRTDAVRERVTERLKVIDRIKEFEPDFNPGLGAIIGTEESRAFQQITDLADFNNALDVHDKNQAAMKRMLERLKDNPGLLKRQELSDILDTMATDTAMIVDNLENQIDDLSSQILEDVFRNTDQATSAGQDLRQNLREVMEIYEATRDDMYGLVTSQIPKGASANSNQFINLIDNLNDPLNPSGVADSRLSYLTRSLPRIADSLKATKKTPAKRITYENLDVIRKALGQEYRDLRDTNPNSRYLPIINNLRNEVGGMMDNIIDNLPDSSAVKKARDDANAFFREEFAPRFREGTVSDIAGDPKGSQIADDAVMTKFWQAGDKTAGAQEFKKIFSDFANPDKADFDEVSIALLEDTAKASRLSLERYALGTLETEFLNNPQALNNPERILKSWQKKYRGALSEFPDIASKVQNTEDAFKAIAEQKQQFMKQKANLDSSIIRKYMNVDPDTVVQKVLSSRFEAERLINSIDSVYGAKTAKSARVKEAVRTVVMNRMLDRTFNPRTEKFSYLRVAEELNKNREALGYLLNSEQFNNLMSFNRGLQILEDAPQILVKAEPNEIKRILATAGVSPASILSRYYSAQLGKVGPLYLGTEAATRFITKRAEVFFQDLYKDIMYNPERLRDLNSIVENGLAQSKGGPRTTVTPSIAGLIIAQSGVDIYGDGGEEVPKEMFEGTNKKVEPVREQPIPFAPENVEEEVELTPGTVLEPVLDETGEPQLTPEGRPIFTGPGGNQVTEFTATITDPRINGGQPTNIPTVFDGQILSEEEAIELVVNAGGVDPITGRNLIGFESMEEAEIAAQNRTDELSGILPNGVPVEDARVLLQGAREIRDFAQGQRNMSQENVTRDVVFDPETGAISDGNPSIR